MMADTWSPCPPEMPPAIWVPDILDEADAMTLEAPEVAVKRGVVDTGRLEVRLDGTCWWTQRWDIRARAWVPCAPVRAEQRMRDGYLTVRATVDGRRVRCMAHRLVYLVHNGPIPEGEEINHVDASRDNNHPDNLVALDPAQNIAWAMSHGELARCPRTGHWRRRELVGRAHAWTLVTMVLFWGGVMAVFALPWIRLIFGEVAR